MKTTQLIQKTIRAGIFAMALFCSSSLFAQVKIGSNPTLINAANNLEVEASTSGRVTSVDKVTGQMTVKDGTEGSGKIFTSDANGGASWQTTTNQTIWIGEQVGVYQVPGWAGNTSDPNDRIPLVPRAGSLVGYDATTKLYTIQQAGYYRIHVGARMTGTTGGSGARLAISLNGQLGPFAEPQTLVYAGSFPIYGIFWEGYFAAGEVYGLMLWNFTATTPQYINVDKGFMSVTKLF
ncbi:hypothetical protein [Dyadobacter frigoris]|uniref:C1q domain-containing protein n=1 Tax=Dyadobacter frigoris TaxID=2576211 RepID=A0A4U6CR34_9BACT|nr:hypothetical protein [Dyadobacter frigoris]TKT85318.1 hypothetical protein FDK13_33965 [Dyadobacter frigoris]GLU56951.1 hypothetical protein Dfri01_64120 [Dyadobacter frigoris]